jgi:RNA polymerase sigma-70 factor (ECF subfamily)
MDDLEPYRRELTAHCYRMLGSGFEAEDAAQEALIRAWRSMDRFEGRSSVRSWLYRIATNVCLDMLRSRQRRASPMDLGPARSAEGSVGQPLGEATWVQPIPDERVVADDGDPAEVAAAREAVRLAFVTALQHLPARQRAVLILREVLRWQATEVAELLDTSVASVNSALQRARATLATCREVPAASGLEDDQQELLAGYVDAFERYDIAKLTSLLHDDVVMSMPPFDFWVQGPAEVGRWFLGGGRGCEGSRLLATRANGGPAFGSYRRDPEGGHKPWRIHVLELRDGRIIGHHSFIEPALFPVFGLPTHLDPLG